MTRGDRPLSLNNNIGSRTVFEWHWYEDGHGARPVLEWGLFYISCRCTTDVECEFSTLVLVAKPMLNGFYFYIGYQSIDVEWGWFLHRLLVNRYRIGRVFPSVISQQM